jgi:hypothetical protein
MQDRSPHFVAALYYIHVIRLIEKELKRTCLHKAFSCSDNLSFDMDNLYWCFPSQILEIFLIIENDDLGCFASVLLVDLSE